MEVAAIGRTEMLRRSILELDAAGHDVTLVVTCDPADFYETGVDAFERAAETVGAAFHHVADLGEVDRLRPPGADVPDVAVSVNWKTIIPAELLDAFEHGVLNYHAGDLPRYRGNAAMNWAIIEGESEIVHTIHRMVSDLDAGPIYRQRAMDVDTSTYIGDVYEFAREHVPEMFVETVVDIEAGRADPTPQSDDPGDVLRCYPRRPADSEISWSEPAERIDRLVRASAEPLFGAFSYLDGSRVRVWRGRAERPAFSVLGTPGQVAERRPAVGEVAVVTGDGFYVIEEAETAEHGRGDPTAIVTSNRDRFEST